MAQSLHILVLGSSSGSATWRAQGHRVTELAGRRRLRTAWRTWRGAGRDADVILEVVDGRSYLTPLWGWLEAPRVVSVSRTGTLFERIYRPLIYGDTPVVGTPTIGDLERAAAGE